MLGDPTFHESNARLVTHNALNKACRPGDPPDRSAVAASHCRQRTIIRKRKCRDLPIDCRVVVASAIVTVMVLIPRPSAAFAADTRTLA
jgi:hypothetical protein